MARVGHIRVVNVVVFVLRRGSESSVVSVFASIVLTRTRDTSSAIVGITAIIACTIGPGTVLMGMLFDKERHSGTEVLQRRLLQHAPQGGVRGSVASV